MPLHLQPSTRQLANRLFQQPVNQNELEGGDGGNQEPDGEFAEAQAALARWREPELDFHGAEGNDVAVAQPRGGLRLVVDGSKSSFKCLEGEAFVLLEFQHEVVVPNPRRVEAQVIIRRTTNVKRKTADDLDVARH